VQDVRLLDGGMAAWCAEGYALETAGLQASLAGALPAAPGWRAGRVARPDYLRNLVQARALQHQEQAGLVSIRSHAEWTGQTSGYSYIAARGEIAGALWGHAGRDGDVNNMGSFQDALGCMKPAAAIEAMWAEAGIHRGMQIGFYCGTGWRASLAFFYAWLMGWEHISVFDGGWMEWSADAANPVQIGSPQSGSSPAD
jgi:thiosulfate/3-mercaptopyruvate sulfurtransferase